MDARYICMQPSFILKEVEVPPLALNAVMNALVRFMAQRARQVFVITCQIEVDAFLSRVEFNFGDTPRRSQPQSIGKQGFNLN
jgi:hypothetical protein